MPDWMLKMMEKLGFTEGASLEDKRLTTLPAYKLEEKR